MDKNEPKTQGNVRAGEDSGMACDTDATWRVSICFKTPDAKTIFDSTVGEPWKRRLYRSGFSGHYELTVLFVPSLLELEDIGVQNGDYLMSGWIAATPEGLDTLKLLAATLGNAGIPSFWEVYDTDGNVIEQVIDPNL